MREVSHDSYPTKFQKSLLKVNHVAHNRMYGIHVQACTHVRAP